jgi:hypothetical protein
MKRWLKLFIHKLVLKNYTGNLQRGKNKTITIIQNQKQNSSDQKTRPPLKAII